MNRLTEAEQQAGWRLLFDGQTLNGWGSLYEQHGWEVVDGAIVATVPLGGRYLYTEEQFEDFELVLDYCLDAGVNSGVFFRWSDLKDPVNTGLEMQIWDRGTTDVIDKHTNGAIYDLVAPSKDATKPVGEWNQARITCKGPHVSIVINGELVAEMNVDLWTEAGKNPDGSNNKFTYAWRDLPRKGHIGLQNYGANRGLIRYRNIKIRRALDYVAKTGRTPVRIPLPM